MAKNLQRKLSDLKKEQERLESEATERAELEYKLKHDTSFGIKTIKDWILRKEEGLEKGFHYSGVNHYHVYRSLTPIIKTLCNIIEHQQKEIENFKTRFSDS